MKKNNIIIDVSGSMKEDGKNFLLDYIFQSIVNLTKKDDFSKFVFDIYIWQDNILKIYPSEEDTKKKSKIKLQDLDFSIKQNEKALTEFIENNSDSSIMLITDGNFSNNFRKTLEKIGKNNPLVLLQFGNDYNNFTNKITKKELIFKTSELISAILKQCTLSKFEEI